MEGAYFYKLRRIWASLISFSRELWMMLAKGPAWPPM